MLECRVRGNPTPTISWLKDGCVLQGDRYRQCYLDDGIYRLEISAPNSSDGGRYTCRAMNDLRTDEISHVVHFDGNIHDHSHLQALAIVNDYKCSSYNSKVLICLHPEDRARRTTSKRDKTFDDHYSFESSNRPRFSNRLTDYSVPTGGTVALQVEVKGKERSFSANTFFQMLKNNFHERSVQACPRRK